MEVRLVVLVLAWALQCFGTDEDAAPTFIGVSGSGSAMINKHGTVGLLLSCISPLIAGRHRRTSDGSFTTTLTVGPVLKVEGPRLLAITEPL